MITTQMDMYTNNEYVPYLIGYTVSRQKILSICFNILIIIEAFILTNQMFEITFSKIIKLDS